jgi:alpha-ketoglutarate-dependent taurine dioxygenase
MDGAAVLETDEDFSAAGVLGYVSAVLGPALRAVRQPVKVRAGAPGSGPHLDWDTMSVHIDSTRSQFLHMDGYGRYGASYPDYVFLLCQRPAEHGGASFVVDCVRLVDELRDDPNSRELAEFLWRQPLEQCSPEGVLWQAPAARRLTGGRRTVLCNDKQHLTGATADQDRLLGAWHQLAVAAAAAAPRFMLRSGDLLCLDNYRVAHGRDPYDGDGRLLHRVWTWSDAAAGVPDPDAADAEGAARDRGVPLGMTADKRLWPKTPSRPQDIPRRRPRTAAHRPAAPDRQPQAPGHHGAGSGGSPRLSPWWSCR